MGSLPRVYPTINVFIAGGSYNGLSTAVNLLDVSRGLPPRLTTEPYPIPEELATFDLQITIVDERDGFFHVIGAPLALASSSYSQKAWVPFGDIPDLQHRNIKVVHGSVHKVDIAAKTATVIHSATQEKTSYQYDYFIAGTGMRRNWPVVPQSLTRKQYLPEVEKQIKAVSNAPDGVIIVGGGAVGIEMAAELKLVQPDTKVTLIHSHDELLSSEGLTAECKATALKLLLEGGVEVKLGRRVTETKNVGEGREEVVMSNGETMFANVVAWAVSRPVPATDYLPRDLVDSQGYIKIEPTMTFHDFHHYAGGDIRLWSGIKRCGGAMHSGHYIARNIHQHILSQHLPETRQPKFEPHYLEIEYVPPMIGLAVGKKAVASNPERTISGEDVMKLYFKDDLGFTICWDYLQLGGRKA